MKVRGSCCIVRSVVWFRTSGAEEPQGAELKAAGTGTVSFSSGVTRMDRTRVHLRSSACSMSWR